jgi:excisionase family DNA binding protein
MWGILSASPSLVEHPAMAISAGLMNVFDAADFLGVHTQTLRKLARSKRIPAFKVGRDWRFQREALIRWGHEQGMDRDRPTTACSVLVVDDDEAICSALSAILRRQGCRPRHATQAERGLELVAQEPPDLVLLDLKMDGMNGPMFLEKLRQTQPILPVVIVTGYPDSDLMKQASLFPPVMLLSKPVAPEHLMRTVKSVVGDTLVARTL